MEIVQQETKQQEPEKVFKIDLTQTQNLDSIIKSVLKANSSVVTAPVVIGSKSTPSALSAQIAAVEDKEDEWVTPKGAKKNSKSKKDEKPSVAPVVVPAQQPAKLEPAVKLDETSSKKKNKKTSENEVKPVELSTTTSSSNSTSGAKSAKKPATNQPVKTSLKQTNLTESTILIDKETLSSSGSKTSSNSRKESNQSSTDSLQDIEGDDGNSFQSQISNTNYICLILK